MGNVIPKHFYKYKNFIVQNNEGFFVDKTDLNRIIDIIKNNRIFLPTSEELNDVFECPNINIDLAVAGSSISRAMRKHHQIVKNAISQFKILSLSDSGVNPVLWAHYANKYYGICLIFEDKGSFNGAIKVQYKSIKIDTIPEEYLNDLDDKIEEYIKNKQVDWSYEREYRIIKKCETPEETDYMNFCKEEFIGIVFGHKLIDMYNIGLYKNELDELFKSIEKYNSSIKLYKTYISETEGKVILLDKDYENIDDGSELEEVIL